MRDDPPTRVRRPASPPRSSDKGRSRIGDITRQISIDRGVSEDRKINRSRRGAVLLGFAAVAVAGALAAALFGLPVRTYLGQDDTLDERSGQLAQLQSVNADLEAEVERLRTDDGIREAAREELGYVGAGEQRESIVATDIVPTDLPDGWPYNLVTAIADVRRASPVAGAPRSAADVPDGAWINRGDTVIYDSPWVRLVTSDVLLPDGGQIDHHVVRLPFAAAGTIIIGDRGVLLLRRHRFITDTWGWEIPAGRVDPGETSDQAAVREAREETGWEPRSVTPLCAFYPANGILDQRFNIFVSHDAVHRGDPTDANEAARIEWVTTPDVRRLLATGEITDGLSFGGLTYALAMGALDG